MKRFIQLISASLATAAIASGGSIILAATNVPDKVHHEVKQSRNTGPWWKHSVFYEIYPRSFCDSDGDGIGDINGITSKLDYLHDLGVDAIWLTPCYPSPQVDFGYDIEDYCNIDPQYGTLADFDRLLAEAKKRNIRVIMDFVLNHTSNQHPWFQASKSAKNDPKRDWYIWRPGKPGGGPPNNWVSIFGHSAWTLDPLTHEYYYHFFYPQQPDLNWRNPKVRKAMYDVVRFWLNRGVSGFRLDAVGCLFEDTSLHDNPVLPGTNNFGDPNTEFKYNDRLPEVHDVLRELRIVLDSYPNDPVLIGETSGKDVAALSTMYGANLDEIQLPMNFFFAYVNKLSAPQFRQYIAQWDNNPAHGWPLWFFSNHDQVRHYIRYGDGVHDDNIAKLTAALLLTLHGTPLLYYGEEIGMENNDPKRVEDVFDPIGKIGWPKEKGRDGERTPMQWNAERYAGFSTHKPWLMLPDSAAYRNVAVENADNTSLLSCYKKLIDLRRTEEPLRDGSYEAINTDDPNVLSYLRKTANGTVLVALNMSDKVQAFKPKISDHPYSAKTWRMLFSSESATSTNEGTINMAPFAVFISSNQK